MREITFQIANPYWIWYYCAYSRHVEFVNCCRGDTYLARLHLDSHTQALQHNSNTVWRLTLLFILWPGVKGFILLPRNSDLGWRLLYPTSEFKPNKMLQRKNTWSPSWTWPMQLYAFPQPDSCDIKTQQQQSHRSIRRLCIFTYAPKTSIVTRAVLWHCKDPMRQRSDTKTAECTLSGKT